jgi:hypothetical protein
VLIKTHTVQNSKKKKKDTYEELHTMPVMVAHTWNPVAQEQRLGGLWFEANPAPYKKIRETSS